MKSEYRDLGSERKEDLNDKDEYICVDDHNNNMNDIEKDVNEVLSKVESIHLPDISILDVSELEDTLDEIKKDLSDLSEKLY